MRLNERKIMECKTVREMEIIFSDLISKSFNNEKFIQLVKENVDSFYNTNNIIETFIDYNENITWDFKRATIEAKLDKFFAKVEGENNIFLKKYAESKIPFGNLGVEIVFDNLKTSLNSIRDVYSTGTPRGYDRDRDHFGVLFTFPSFTAISDSLKKYTDDITIYVDYGNLLIDRENNRTTAPVANINFRHRGKQEFKEQVFENFPKYMNIVLYNRNAFIGSFNLDIRKLDIMKPYKLKLESKDNTNKSILEIAIFKWSKEGLKEQDSALYNYFFSEPNYLYDKNLENLIHGFDKHNLDELLKRYLVIENDPLITRISKIDNFTFMLDEFRKNLLGASHKIVTQNKTLGGEDHITNSLNNFFKNVFDDSDTQNLCADWTKNTDSSFEEVLYAVCLVDPSTITIYEKLKLIYDIARMRSYIIFNDDNLTISKLKELIYSLYKRYMVYFTKADVDRMINYLLRKEGLPNFKHVLVYDNKSQDLILNILSECDNINLKDIKNILKIEPSYNIIDLRRNLTIIVNLLVNLYNVNRISGGLLNSVLDFLVGSQIKNTIYTKLKVDFNNENVRKIKETEVSYEEGHKLSELFDNLFDFSEVTTLRYLFETALAREINSFELNCNENIEITFDKFKDIFFNLPFIPDLFRATCCFNTGVGNKFIKAFEKVDVEVYADRSNVRHFIFSTKKVIIT
jgi:hypothetical protein